MCVHVFVCVCVCVCVCVRGDYKMSKPDYTHADTVAWLSNMVLANQHTALRAVMLGIVIQVRTVDGSYICCNQ